MQFDFLLKALKTSRLSAIVSGAILTLGALTALEINNRAEAIVVPGNPNDYIVSPGTGYDGVVSVNIYTNFGAFSCSGSLLPTGLHILTAAHCLSSSIDTIELAPLGTTFAEGAKAFFDLPTGTVTVNATEFYVHPNWNGRYYNGNDIAIIKLAEAAPAAAERYDIYRGNDEVDQTITRVGYGATGNGNNNERFFDINKRAGQNTYDAVANILNGAYPGVDFPEGSALLFDFDNGNPANDALGVIAGIPNLGLGQNEVYPSFGDSGGPNFINGLIAGITSDAIRPLLPSEVDNEGYNSTFGEISFDTRVSYYASYVDSVLAGQIAPTKQIPEPNTIFGTVFVLGAFGISSRFKKKVKETTTAS